MLLLLLACATTSSFAPQSPAAAPPDADAKVQAYAQEVARICAERDPEVVRAAQSTCTHQHVGPLGANDALAAWWAASHPQTERNLEHFQEVPVACAAPVDVSLVQPSAEEPVPEEEESDREFWALTAAAVAEEDAKAAYQAAPTPEHRERWTQSLSRLQQACVAFPSED